MNRLILLLPTLDHSVKVQPRTSLEVPKRCRIPCVLHVRPRKEWRGLDLRIHYIISTTNMLLAARATRISIASSLQVSCCQSQQSSSDLLIAVEIVSTAFGLLIFIGASINT